MKRFFYFAAAIIGGSLLFSSCETTEVIERTEIHHNNGRSLWLQVKSNEWRSENNGEKWVVSVSVPEIDKVLFENGTVLADISFGDGVFEPLTSVYNGLAYRYDYSIGELLIDVVWADGRGGPVDRPGDLTLKVILLDADPIN